MQLRVRSMPTSNRLKKFSHLFNLLSVLVKIHRSSSSFLGNYCTTDANYASPSAFQANLQLLLASLASGAVATGYHNDTKGQPPNQVHGLALCRGDASSAVCRTCLNSSAHDILQGCPLAKSSTIWYDDCLLRYSDRSFFSTVDISFPLIQFNGYNASNPQAFDRSLRGLLDVLIAKAANNSAKMFAAGSANVTNTSTTIYGRDLSEDGCGRCLGNSVANLSSCCYGQKGMKVYGQSCYMRYEVYPFYDLPSDVPVLLPPPSVAPPLPWPVNNTTSDATPDAASKGNKSKTWKRIVIISTSGLSFLVFCSLFWWKCSARLKGYWKKRIQQTDRTMDLLGEVNSDFTGPSGEGKNEERKGSKPLLFTFASIATATDDFSDSNKLGKGGFGHVYKGTLPGGQEIAVKRLSKTSHQGLEEFKNEVMVVATLQHRNLVRLLGYCTQGEEKILIYEYMPNKSLEAVLFDPQKKASLDWKTRFNIIEGLVRGLIYLHRDSNSRIAHRDLKPSNVLLDKDMNPKISDFGFARIFGDDQNQGNTRRPAGTVGYMSPEYVIRGLFSDKSDLYSFGIIVLELVTGRRSNSFHVFEDTPTIAGYAWHLWNEGKAEDLVEPSIRTSCSMSQVLRCIHIGLLCVQDRADDRPNMPWIDYMIASESNIPRVPKQPTFVLEPPNGAETVANKHETRNDITITSLRGR